MKHPASSRQGFDRNSANSKGKGGLCHDCSNRDSSIHLYTGQVRVCVQMRCSVFWHVFLFFVCQSNDGRYRACGISFCFDCLDCLRYFCRCTRSDDDFGKRHRDYSGASGPRFSQTANTSHAETPVKKGFLQRPRSFGGAAVLFCRAGRQTGAFDLVSPPAEPAIIKKDTKNGGKSPRKNGEKNP